MVEEMVRRSLLMCVLKRVAAKCVCLWDSDRFWFFVSFWQSMDGEHLGWGRNGPLEKEKLGSFVRVG